MLTRTIIAIAALALVCSGAPVAQQTDKPKPADSAKSKTEDVAIKFDVMDSQWGEQNGKKDTVRLVGNIRITHGDTVLTCDEVLYDRVAKIAVSPGKLTIADPECHITGDSGTAYLKKRIGVVEGNVTMLVKPKPEAEPSKKSEDSNESVRGKLSKPTTVTCEKLEYNYRKKIASATGGVDMKQEKRAATAKKLIYDDKQELLTLLGDVKGVDEDGQTLSAPEKIEICTRKGAEWMKVYNGVATFKVETDEEE